MTGRRRRGLAVAALSVSLALIAGCTSGGHSGSRSSASASGLGGASPTPTSVDQVQQSLLGSAASTPAPAVASRSARIREVSRSDRPVALTADVISVSVSSATSVLHWRLRSTSGATVQGFGNWASGGRSSNLDTSQVGLIDPVAKVKLLPYFNPGQAIFADGDCVCSSTPRTVDGTGVDLYATYPAVSATATTVTVTIPGFSAMSGIPVSRG